MKRTLSNKISSQVIFGLCILFTSLLFTNSLVADQIILTYSFDKKVIVFNIAAAICLIFFCTLLFRNQIYLKKTDISLVVLTTYIVINSVANRNMFDNYLLSIVACSAVVVLLGNVIIKLNSREEFLLLIYTIVVTISILINVYSILQLFGFLQKNTINIAGTFHNSGIFAIYTSIIWSMSFGFYMVAKNTQLKNRMIHHICGVNILLGIIVLPSTHSRSSWIGVILVVLLYCLSKNKRSAGLITSKKILIVTTVTSLLLTSFFAMYFFKKDSADGRMIIWKTGLIAAQDTPLTGIGFGQIKNRFPDYQEIYFSGNPKDAFQFADKVNYAFNDLLQLLIENGIVGVILLVIFMITVLTKIRSYSFSDPVTFGALSGLIAFFSASLFSYPLEIVSLYFLLFFLIFIICRDQEPTYVVNPLISKIFYVIIITGSIYLFEKQVKVLQSKNEVERAQFAITNEDYEFAKEKYIKALGIMPDEINILPGYGLTLLKLKEYDQSIKVLLEADKHLSDTYISCNLGLAYSAIGNYTKSEFHLKKAIAQMPNRMYSKYLLANMYKESNDYANAATIASEIVSMPVKIESAATMDMRSQMQNLLKTIN